jgi:hypothetical protein
MTKCLFNRRSRSIGLSSVLAVLLSSLAASPALASAPSAHVRTSRSSHVSQVHRDLQMPRMRG